MSPKISWRFARVRVTAFLVAFIGPFQIVGRVLPFVPYHYIAAELGRNAIGHMYGFCVSEMLGQYLGCFCWSEWRSRDDDWVYDGYK